MGAYVDMAFGFGLVFAYFWVTTSPQWHRFMHANRDGRYFGGRLVCRRCANEASNVTRDEWREEVLDRVRRVL